MNIEQYKKELRGLPKDRWPALLETTHKKILFLQSIYETGGENSFFSQEFQSAAHKERQELCQLSSALHSLIKGE